ncbi:MAG: ammonium transporter [Abitibacteriaceae bacterium]|nr:ammonium transporter [Abditibacteriaceae bacterium]MBV9867340.1 ammonium transporter [Abditibacteriaceae bacterium]
MVLAVALTSVVAHADDAAATPKIDSGDTAWMLTSAAFVLLMTPALGFFYAGMVRQKNALNTLMLSFAAAAVIGVSWVVVGYSLAFSPLTDGIGNFVGDLRYIGLNGVGLDGAPLAKTIPHQAFMIYQAMFAIITPALISGSVVERMKFKTFLVFMFLWGLFVYCPVAHWVWGGGWLGKMGAMDFAGGTVVHVNAGFSALVAAILVGPRRDYKTLPLRPHNLPFTLLGAGLLWFGWFGFNAGSALASGQLATAAFVNTNTATAAAMLTWMLLDQITRKEMTALGGATGAVAGLVGITPAAGFVSPMGALALGAIVSAVCFCSANWRAKSSLDDSLDAFAVHGVGGYTGAILTGVFSIGYLKTSNINPLALPGLLEGHPGTVVTQFLAASASAIYAMAVSFVLLKILDATMGLRVSEETEQRGLDIVEQGEEAYGESVTSSF